MGRRTAESIEEAKQQHDSGKRKKDKGRKPENRKSSGKRRTLPDAARPFMFKPGQSGNPGGRPKNDLAKEIAKALFEQDGAAIYAAFREALRKGNAYTFGVLADRAFGKVKERIEHSVDEQLLEALDAGRKRNRENGDSGKKP